MIAGASAAGGLYYFAKSLGPLDVSMAKARSPVVVDRDGRLLRPFTTRDGRWRIPVHAAEVDPRYFKILMAYEDRRFEAHRGVDLKAMARAAIQLAAHGRIVSGGSTLTMQVARLLEPREERGLSAKLRQIVRAWQLERAYSKQQILDLYLALAPYGGNIEGLRAASLTYFGKEPRRLSFGEAALLVALPQAPETRRPDRFSEIARRARDRVLDRAAEWNVIAMAEAERAKGEPVPKARRPFPMLAAHAAEAALKQTPNESVIKLTIDARLQASLEELVRQRVEKLGPKLAGAILAVDHATGEVRAHVGGGEYLSGDRAGGVDLAFAVRSPGSALKPFIYALAFENGVAHPETMLEDRPSRFGIYAPENFDQTYQGNVTARKALQNSLNVPAVELLAEVNPQNLLTRLKGAGADLVLPKDSSPGLAIGLGGVGIRLADLARLYAGLARGGDTIPLVWRANEAKTQQPRRLTSRVSAWYIADILRGAPPPVNAPQGRIAFKTGTSYGYRDAWSIGYDRNMTIAVWIGRPDGASVSGLVGRQVAAPILFDAFSRAGIDSDFPPPPGEALIATNATLPPPLRNLKKDAPKTAGAVASIPLRIAFPLADSRIDLGLARGVADGEPLVMKATGGVAPFTWLVNGKPVAEQSPRRQATWAPDGAGFAQLSIVDANGATASVKIRLD
ncbi:penicillin-binding protein 1C [Terrarubrum flagellatum]|uniref:penicillin-binding protein 1C n=1 Tax=Terrirubrum flagellatum TaxID=2895980 RepID=UPI0031456A42